MACNAFLCTGFTLNIKRFYGGCDGNNSKRATRNCCELNNDSNATELRYSKTQPWLKYSALLRYLLDADTTNPNQLPHTFPNSSSTIRQGTARHCGCGCGDSNVPSIHNNNKNNNCGCRQRRPYVCLNFGWTVCMHTC